MLGRISSRDHEVLAYFDLLIVSFSGGKDSTACLLWALDTGKVVRAVMADTGNELPDMPDYIRYVERRLGVKVEVYQRPGHTFHDLVLRRKMWPIPRRCLVSSTTKRDDFRWYLQATSTPESALVILGQRRGESASRAHLPDFTPISRAGRPVYRPILDWSVDDVFAFLDERGVQAHPAYSRGRKRVGCVWCVHSSLEDLILDEELYPQRCAELRALRTRIGLPSVPQGVTQTRLFEPPLCKYESVHCE